MDRIVEVTVPTTLCAQCGKPTNGIYTCRTCGKEFCKEHAHMLALTKAANANFIYACEECIRAGHLQVIDQNHPLYMQYGGIVK